VADPQHVPAVVVALPAEIDVANAGQLGQQLGSAFAPSVTTVIADMTATTFCDSSGIKMLLQARKQLPGSHAATSDHGPAPPREATGTDGLRKPQPAISENHR
jgi:STAS domain